VNMNQITRPTNMALAFLLAAVPCLKASGARGPWTARRVAVNADREIGTTTERAINAHLSHKTAETLKKQGVIL
jgi:hypothetical protein